MKQQITTTLSECDLILNGEIIDLPNDMINPITSSVLAQKTWNSLTVNAQQNYILWVVSAKNKDTRVKRIIRGVEELEQGKKRPCCFGGKNWLIKTQKK
jgi:uncharacterized protein YdeI (YjbR/CyaY-like superfamily)